MSFYCIVKCRKRRVTQIAQEVVSEQVLVLFSLDENVALGKFSIGNLTVSSSIWN